MSWSYGQGEQVAKFHWHLFSYFYYDGMKNEMICLSHYTPLWSPKVTLDIIQRNRIENGIPDGAALVACSHLGEMTKAEFKRTEKVDERRLLN